MNELINFLKNIGLKKDYKDNDKYPKQVRDFLRQSQELIDRQIEKGEYKPPKIIYKGKLY